MVSGESQTGRTHPFRTPVRIVGGWCAGFVLVSFCVLAGYLYLTEYIAPAFIDPLAAEFGSLALIAGFWTCCARLFRGDGEPVRPPRPWWKMTHRSPASWFFAVVIGGTFVWNVVLVATGSVIRPGDSLGWILLVALRLVAGAALASLFVNSAIRLGRENVPENPTGESVRSG